MDQFDELNRRSVQCVVFGPERFWRKLGNNQVLRDLVGDQFPVFFVPLERVPPALVNGTRYEFKDEHFGAHAFLSYSASGPAGTIKGVSRLCMLDAASRAATEWLIETTRDMNGELGGLPGSFFFAAADVQLVDNQLRRMGTLVCSGVLQIRLQHLVNAYTLWKATPAGDRDALRDRRCPSCRPFMAEEFPA